jgi:hypothetical protein
MAEPSAGSVAVEVIVTFNHCTELATGTTATGGMLGVDVRCRVAIVLCWKLTPWRHVLRGTPREGRVEPRRRGDRQTQ